MPTDWGFKLPDIVHDLSYVEQYKRSRHNADLCTLDERRHFIRGLLPIPLPESGEEFNWGIWVEVDLPTHTLYVDGFNADLSGQPRSTGAIANKLSVYGQTIGLPVQIQYNPGNARPSFWLPEDQMHALALEQRGGITLKRQHSILEELGFFKKDDA